MSPLWSKSYPIHTYDVDFRGCIRITSLLNFLQDASWDHTVRLGVSVPQLRRRRLTWILSRYHVRMVHYPRLDETVEIRTWPSHREGKGTLRDFEMVDGKGGQLATASTSWVLLDLESKRPVPLEGVLPDYPILARRAVTTDFPLPEPVQKIDRELPFRVRIGDLDMNQHVNNVVYAGWALETVPEEVLREALPAEIEISYRAEAFYGDRIFSRLEVLSEGDEPAYLHQLVREGDGKELTRLKTSWRPRERMADVKP